MPARPPLDELNDVIPELTRVLRRPAFRNRLIALLGTTELSTVSVLRAVERRGDDRTSIGDIAESMSIDASTASRFVERAVQGEYLQRNPCADDRRRTRLHITDDGRDLLRITAETRRQIMGEVTATWKPQDVATFVRLAHALIDGFDRLDDR